MAVEDLAVEEGRVRAVEEGRVRAAALEVRGECPAAPADGLPAWEVNLDGSREAQEVLHAEQEFLGNAESPPAPQPA